MNNRNFEKQKKVLLLSTLLVLSVISITSCSKKLPNPKWSSEITGSSKGESSSQTNIAIDIYIDATTSMEGFAIGDKTVYGQFIDQLEASALSAWKSADIKYFKFGEIIKPVQRPEFLTAKDNLSFYREKGVFTKTYIDSVINKTDNQRLSVVITDLFQDEGDVNIMVEQIKKQCFNRKVMLGILGIKTEFNGLVFDTPNYPKGYRLKTSTRPFYALIFGNPLKMERLFEVLKTKEFVKENQILLISDQIMKSSNITILKTKDSKYVNKKASAEQIKNSYDFSMKAKGEDAKFNFELNFDKNTRCIDFNENTLTAVVYKKSITDPKVANPDSVLTNDFQITNIMRVGTKITATLILHNEDPVGNYSYLIYLQPNQINGFILPQWVRDFSTDNPVPKTPSESLTYNLEKLVNTLIIAKNAVSPTYVSKSFINIYKR